MVNAWKPLAILAKSSILDIGLTSEYALWIHPLSIDLSNKEKISPNS